MAIELMVSPMVPLSITAVILFPGNNPLLPGIYLIGGSKYLAVGFFPSLSSPNR